MFKFFELLINITLTYATPLMWAASGSILAESCGITNIGIEGMMTVGAFIGALLGFYIGNPWLAFVGSALSGGIVGLFFAFVTVSKELNQIVCGIAINFMCEGATLTMAKAFFNGATQTLPVKNKLPDVIKFSHPFRITLNVSTILVLIIFFVVWVLFYYTVFGFHIRVTGKNEKIASSHGISTTYVRYVCLVLSGVLSAAGGATMTLFIVSQFMPTTISGQGFIAIAAVVFGSLTPQKTMLSCLLFGFAQAVAIMIGGTDFFVPSEFLAMVPYIATILFLCLKK